MEIIMTTGTGSLALARYGWQPARTRSLRAPRHLVKFHNPVAPIGTDVPVAGRMRVSAPQP